ncbi:MAG: hypothetical protein KDC45_04675, partial [Bacteroidetes bacterium]|nr:hypothetical protein [Bacteroidota bacterium]
FSRKFQFQRIPGTFTYEYQFTVDNGQLRGFNQLVLDFITASTIIRRNKPYDSRLIMISYRVTD